MKRGILLLLLTGCAPQELILVDPWSEISQKKEVQALVAAADYGSIPRDVRQPLAGVLSADLRRFDGLRVTPMEGAVDGVRTLAERLSPAPNAERVAEMAHLADVDLVVLYELLGYHERPLTRSGQLWQSEAPKLDRTEVALRLRIGIYDRRGHLLWQNQGDAVDQLLAAGPTDQQLAAFRESLMERLVDRLLVGLQPYYSYR